MGYNDYIEELLVDNGCIGVSASKWLRMTIQTNMMNSKIHFIALKSENVRRVM